MRTHHIIILISLRLSYHYVKQDPVLSVAGTSAHSRNLCRQNPMYKMSMTMPISRCTITPSYSYSMVTQVSEKVEIFTEHALLAILL